MSTKPRNTLSPKQIQILQYLERGFTSPEAAKHFGISRNYIDSLIAGDVDKGGSPAVLFSQELKKIRAERDKAIKENRKKSEIISWTKIREYLETIGKKPVDSKKLRELLKILEIAGKSTPKVEIGSFSYTKGLSAEDLLNEFKRLKGIAALRPDSRGVQEASGRGEEEVSDSEESGSDVAKLAEAAFIRAKSKVKELPPVDSTD